MSGSRSQAHKPISFKGGRFLPAFAVVGAMWLSAGAAPAATYTWTGNSVFALDSSGACVNSGGPGNGDWSDATNWGPPCQPAGPPGPGDTAVIRSNGTAVLHQDVTVAGLNLDGNLTGFNAPFTITITNSFNWVNGSIGDNVVLTPTCTAILTGTAPQGFNNQVCNNLTNQGTLIWQGPGSFSLGLTNSGTIDIQADGIFGNGFTLNNSGTIKKSAGTGVTQTGTHSWTNNSTGVIDVESGELRLDPDPNNPLDTFHGGTTITGAGRLVELENLSLDGTININGTLQMGAIGSSSGPGLNGGFAGAGTSFALVGTGHFDWMGAGIGGDATFTPGFTVNVSGPGSKTLVSGTYTNAGTLNWLGGANIATSRSPLINSGTFNVQAAGMPFSGLFTNTGTLNTFPGGTTQWAGPLNNSGIINVGGAGTVGVLAMVNTGVVQAPAGTINMDIGGTTAGTQFDQMQVLPDVNVPGSLHLDGTLNVSLINGFTPRQTDRFEIAKAFGNISGTFAAVNGPPSAPFTAQYSSTSVTLSVPPPAPLSLSMKTNKSTVVTGDIISYTATATVTGTGHARGLALVAQLPTGTSFDSAYFVNAQGSPVTAPANPNSRPGAIRHNPELVKDAFGNLTGVVWYFDLDFQTPAAARYLQLNAQVQWDDPAPTVVHTESLRRGGVQGALVSSASATVGVAGVGHGAPSLGLSLNASAITDDKNDDRVTVLPGGEITYSATAFNTGRSKAKRVRVSIALPEHTSYVPGSVTLNGLPIQDADLALHANVVGCDVGDLAGGGPTAAGSEAVVLCRAKVAANVVPGTLLESSGLMHADNLSFLIPAQPFSVEVEVINPVSFDFSVAADKSVARQGDSITYTIHYRNAGDVAASKVQIEDVLPLAGGLVFDTATFPSLPAPALKPPTGQAGTVRWDLPSLAKHTEGQVKLQVKVAAAAKVSVANTARITSGKVTATSLPVETRIIAPANTRVAINTRIHLVLADGGQKFGYFIDYENLGDAPAKNVKVSIELGAAVQEISDGAHGYPTTPGFTTSGSLYTWNIGTVEAHRMGVLQLSVHVIAANFTGPITSRYSHITASNAQGKYSPAVTITVQPAKFLGLFSVARLSPDGLDSRGEPKNVLTDFAAWLWSSVGSVLSGIGSGIGQLVDAIKAGGQKGQDVKADLTTINTGSTMTSIGGADSIQGKNGVVYIPLGGGQWEVHGPASLVAAGAGNIVSTDGSSLVAAGAGNAITVGGKTVASLVAAGAGNIVSTDGSNLVSAGGGNLISQDGSSLISNDGSSLRPIHGQSPGLVPLDHGNGFLAGKGNIVSTDGSSLVAAGAGNVVSHDAGSLVAAGAGNLVAAGAGNFISHTGSALTGKAN